MIKQLTAVTLHRFLKSGRNEPALFACLDEQGQPAGDYVVKFAGNTTQQGLAHELIGSLLAEHFHLLHPAPAIVQIHPELISWLQRSLPHKSAVLATSTGLNFGSEYLTDTPTWPSATRSPTPCSPPPPTSSPLTPSSPTTTAAAPTPPSSSAAANSSSSITNWPSHPLLTPQPRPTLGLTSRNNLQEHVFFYTLRKKSLNFGRFIQQLTESIISAIPDPWRSDQIPKTSTHLKQVRDNARKRKGRGCAQPLEKTVPARPGRAPNTATVLRAL